MKKSVFFFAAFLSINALAQTHETSGDSNTACCTTSQCDSINIPVYIVDGVEVPDLNEIATDDIVKVEIIKDPAITKIFSPRLGGIVLITTKSRKFLNPILENYHQTSEELRQKRIAGQLIIR